MSVRRKAAGVAVLGFAPLVLTTVTASPAAAHGSMDSPVSRVSACFAEGPESPTSAACKAAVKASGAQAFYDWNEVNIPDAAGKHRDIIPDGELCSAGRDKYRGLDLPREDWPANKLSAGRQTFEYQATAPHEGSFELYITEDGYDPSTPLKWSDLESKPFAKVKDPELKGGTYLIEGEVPKKSGRHLIYAIWQRSDSPEAFYSCSDVTFDGGAGSASSNDSEQKEGSDGSSPRAPSERQVAEGAEKSTVDHDGHGGAHQQHGGHGGEHQQQGGTEGESGADQDKSADDERSSQANTAEEGRLAETGGDDHTGAIALGGAAALGAGAAVVLTTARRRSLARQRG